MKQLLPELSDLCPPVPNGACPNRYRRAFGRVVVPKADPPKA